MTSPLSETIARVAARLERAIASERAFRLVDVEDDELTALLSCARRCEAIDSVESRLDDLRAMADSGMSVIPGSTVLDLIDLYEDAAAERDVLAKRVRELGLDFSNCADVGRRLEAESARLRAENERLAAEADRFTRRLHDSATNRERAALLDLTATQERVRELEGALSATVRALHEHGHKQEASTFYRYLPPLGTSKQPGPITDPAQGASDCLHVGSNRWDTDGPAPDCIPPGTPRDHCDQLPSGLWAWVEGDVVRIDDPADPFGSYIMRYDSHRRRIALKAADFLAARELGKKWLGWES